MPSKRISISAVIAYAGFTVALLYLLYFHLESGAPLHSAGHPSWWLAQRNASLNFTDSIFAKASNGKNVVFHLNASPDDWTADAADFAYMYFSAVYHQYPRAVTVGDGKTIINYAVDLQKADDISSQAWLHQYHVAARAALVPGDPNSPQILIHQLP